MASLSEIYSAITEQDFEKEAQAAEAEGYVLIEEDVLEKAAHYDQIGRNLARQMFEQGIDPELAKEAMGGGMPPAMMAAAAAKAKSKSEGSEEESEEKDEDEEKKKKKGPAEMAEKMEEKKASVIQAMYDDPEYLQYILDKYVTQ